MAYKILGAKGLTGNTGESLDSIPSNILQSGDIAIVEYITSDGGDDKVYFYKFVESTNKTQSSPDVIIPYDSTGNTVWGTWEILDGYISSDGYDDIVENIKSDFYASSYIILNSSWSTAGDGTYYYNITHNLSEEHPIITVWNLLTNQVASVIITSIDEDNIRIESNTTMNLKVKILK